MRRALGVCTALGALALGTLSACHRAAPRAPRDTTATGAAAPSGVSIPRDAARFEIESVDDSTARFRPFEARWLRSGMTVYAVDPTKRDALVARLRIVRADSGRFVALVTSQVTRVSTEHFLLAVRPAVPWYGRAAFWGGVIGGIAAGVGGAIVVR